MLKLQCDGTSVEAKLVLMTVAFLMLSSGKQKRQDFESQPRSTSVSSRDSMEVRERKPDFL
jgi:hypothetical protein